MNDNEKNSSDRVYPINSLLQQCPNCENKGPGERIEADENKRCVGCGRILFCLTSGGLNDLLVKGEISPTLLTTEEHLQSIEKKLDIIFDRIEFIDPGFQRPEDDNE